MRTCKLNYIISQNFPRSFAAIRFAFWRCARIGTLVCVCVWSRTFVAHHITVYLHSTKFMRFFDISTSNPLHGKTQMSAQNRSFIKFASALNRCACTRSEHNTTVADSFVKFVRRKYARNADFDGENQICEARRWFVFFLSRDWLRIFWFCDWLIYSVEFVKSDSEPSVRLTLHIYSYSHDINSYAGEEYPNKVLWEMEIRLAAKCKTFEFGLFTA